MSHSITFKCDQCESNYVSDPSLDMPPYWIGTQFAIANSDGLIPEQETEVILHFCSKECLTNYIKGEDFKRRLAIIDDVD